MQTHCWSSLEVCRHAAGTDPPGSCQEMWQTIKSTRGTRRPMRLRLLIKDHPPRPPLAPPPSYCVAVSSPSGTGLTPRGAAAWTGGVRSRLEPRAYDKTSRGHALFPLLPPPPGSCLLWIVGGALVRRRSSEEVSWMLYA